MNRKIARQNLLDVKKILDKHKIKFWLNTGTLLGAIREKNFIKWDHDIDLRVKVIEWKHSIIHAFKAKKFKFRIVRPRYAQKSSLIKYIQLTRNNGCPINIAFAYFYRPDSVYITWANKPDDILNLTPAHFYRQDEFIKFLETKFLAPHDPISFLMRVYGKRWKIPIKKKERCWAPKNYIKLDRYLKWFKEHPEELRFSRRK